MSYTPEHHIQRTILVRLSRANVVRFSDLKPANLESNIFMYHLKQLMTHNLVVKQGEEGYALSPAGLAFIDKISFASERPRQQPKIISLIHIRDSKGNILLWRRNVQPFLHRVDAVQGKIHLGESAHEAAERELSEKTGLVDVKVVYRGTVNMQFWTDGTLISQVLAQVFSGQVTTKEPALHQHKLGTAFWGKPDKLDSVQPSYYFVEELLKVHNHTYFFAEQAFDL